MSESILLTHFSTNSFKFNSNINYKQPVKNVFKPHGLWLSDESGNDGWKRWCESEEFGLDRLENRVDFQLDVTDILILNSCEKLKEFTKEYEVTSLVIDWKKVSEKYSGIVISPYQWKVRLRVMWYYGWDCASACIWDLSKLKEVYK